MTHDFANDVLPYLLLSFFLFIISIFIMRWIFRVDKLIRLQQKQYEVFLQIALKMNVDRNDLLRIDNPHEHWKQQQKQKNEQGK
jgi:hypothetical protein